MSGAALTRRERQLLRAIERELERDEQLDRQFRGAPARRRRRRHLPRPDVPRLVREHGLILLIPLCAVMLAASLGGAPTALMAAAAVVWLATLGLVIERVLARRRHPGRRGDPGPRNHTDPPNPGRPRGHDDADPPDLV